jgi:hypothetical protein
VDAAAQAADSLRVKAAVVECLRVLRAHRGRLALVAFLAAFSALVVWLSVPRSTNGDDALPTAVAAHVRSAPSPDAAVAAASPAVTDPSPVADSLAIEKVEVCGVGWIDADAEGAVDIEAVLGSPAMAEASARLLESIRADGDFGAVTALALQPSSSAVDNTTSPVPAGSDCGGGPCDATSQQRAGAASLLDRMSRLASATSDPRVYSLVLELCSRRSGDGPCSTLNVAQWAHLDPDNGEPWLYVLAEAVERRDTSAIDDALFHIAAARHFDDFRLAEAKQVAQHAGEGNVDLLAAEELSTIAAAVRSTGPAGGMQAVLTSCSVGELVEPNRKELCDKAASALQDRSGSLVTMRIGSAVGRRLGWPDGRFETADAIMAARPDSHPPVLAPVADARPAASLRRPLDCASIAKLLRYVAEVATIGEREYTRRWIERSERADHYLQLGRAQRARIVAAEAAQAVRAASAPAT